MQEASFTEASCVSFCFRFFLSVSIDEKQNKVKGYHCKINAIDNQNVSDVMIDDLTDNTGNVAN